MKKETPKAGQLKVAEMRDQIQPTRFDDGSHEEERAGATRIEEAMGWWQLVKKNN